MAMVGETVLPTMVTAAMVVTTTAGGAAMITVVGVATGAKEEGDAGK
jgi:hypothetical protein